MAPDKLFGKELAAGNPIISGEQSNLFVKHEVTVLMGLLFTTASTNQYYFLVRQL
jgi:hypothetical protein